MAQDAAAELDFLHLPPSPQSALAALPEYVRAWFSLRFGEPTPGQRLAWPAVAAGRNLFLCAPTGSGKTLAAFLPVFGRLLNGTPGAAVRCLYVAPLRALTADVRNNLRDCLDDLAPFLPEGSTPVRVEARTGDTSAQARKRMLREPPDVLLTTPESLAVLLASPGGRDLLGGVSTVVLDEVHALAACKRGADLSLSLERLEDLAGGAVQRIGLSATCAPIEEAARFLVGAGRPCPVALVPDPSPPALRVEPLPETGAGFCERVLVRLRPELEANRTTLVFANTRGLAERLAWALRRTFPERLDRIAVHHSSLAATRRRDTERLLKQGKLWAVVSSTSLELGIDVGAVDGVVLVHPPGGVVRMLQRTGRAGHAPGRPRRALVLTESAAGLLEAAVTAASCPTGQVESLRVPARPLDVLCQHLVSMGIGRLWRRDDALALVRRAWPYRDLCEPDFDVCLDYLCGLAADGAEWLPARLCRDGDRFTVAGDATARLLRRNLGTILAEESRPVRLEDGGGVGQVDEAFAERLQPGDRFVLDGRCLELKETEGDALTAAEVTGRPAVPRWASDAWPLSAGLAGRLYVLRTQAAEALAQGPEALGQLLRREYGLEGPACEALAAFFRRQEAESEIPDPRTLLVECVRTGEGAEYYLHTPLNRAGNDALARVAAYRLLHERGRSSASVVADLGLVLSVPGDDLLPEDFRGLLRAADFDAHLERAVAGSDALRERFRRVATTGLMLLRNPLGGRRKVGGAGWGERRLFDQVRAAEPGFVLLRQALREVTEECLDATTARAFAGDLLRLGVRCRWLPHPSPFAEGWTQAQAGPVELAEDPAAALERLHAALLLPGAAASTIAAEASGDGDHPSHR